MKSKIRDELAKACGIKVASIDEDVLPGKLVEGISEVDDDTWNGLSTEAMEWFNSAADAVNKKKAIPKFPDAVEDEPEAETKPARRGAAKAAEEPAEIETGHVYVITTKRGKEVKGKCVEVDDDIVVLEKADGEEVELSKGSIDTFNLITETKAARKSKDVDAEEVAEQSSNDAPYEPEVGDNVTVTTKRGKEVKGTVAEILEAGDLLVLEVDGEEVEFTLSTSTVVKNEPTKKAASKAKEVEPEDEPEEEAKPARRGAAKAAEEPAEKKPRVTAAANGGVSATQRMRELVCENRDASKADIGKLLTKESITFRDTTLDLVYADTQKVLAILAERKLLK